MQIVSQSASLSHSLFPPSRPLLADLPPPKLVCAPKIAVLLPIRVGISQLEIIQVLPLSHVDLLQQLGPLRNRDEMNAELTDLVLELKDIGQDRDGHRM